MSPGFAILIFLASFALAIVSSFVLANSINRIGVHLGFSGALLGLITAVGADSPEISSTATALMSGQHDLALGVVLGSNIFNIAAMLGVGAVVAGYVRISFRGLIFNGSVSFAITLVAAALVLGWTPPWLSFLLIVVIIGPYVVVCAIGTRHLPRFMRRFLAKALREVQHDVRKEEARRRASWSSNLTVVPAVASVVWASIGMVHAAVTLAEAWRLPHVIVGILILATLTGVPNMLTALELARHGHGSAVVSEALNSNNVNVIIGLCLPAIFVGIAHPSKLAAVALLWLLGITFLALVLAITRKGIRRWEGALLIVIYLCFAVFVVIWKG
jgi:cation:H+ antiporter